MLRHLAAPAILALALAAPAAADTRPLNGFNSVNAEDQLHVEVAIGPAFSVQIDGRDAARVRTFVRNRELHIQQTNRPWFGDTPTIDARVRVTMPDIASLSSSRGALMTAADVRVEDIVLAAAMGGELNVSGACANLDVSVSMGGIIRAGDFHCSTADASASMGGEARIYADHTLDASASMGGIVNVAGSPATADVSTSMGGEVNR
jgi:Putative auto-transporter adhesin, head GIN domain